LLRTEANLEFIRVYDIRPGAAEALGKKVASACAVTGVHFMSAASAREAVEGAEAVVTVTTVVEGEGYLALDWLAPDTVVAHVSLDDLLPETVLGATCIVVDDWSLVRTDPRRLFGRMIRAGLLTGPIDGENHAETTAVVSADARRVDGHIADYLPGGTRTPPDSGVVIVNPFGMALQDIVLGDLVAGAAHAAGLGTFINR
jgi:ornithine cyclodeaminase/alanine dehydrogenase-like protein (mu-crystallin family)